MAANPGPGAAARTFALTVRPTAALGHDIPPLRVGIVNEIFTFSCAHSVTQVLWQTTCAAPRHPLFPPYRRIQNYTGHDVVLPPPKGAEETTPARGEDIGSWLGEYVMAGTKP